MTSSFHEHDYEEAKNNVLSDLLYGPNQKMYVEAWKGVGATALLREVAEEVESKYKNIFETVIKVLQPAPFQNPREIQRAVAKQLNLPPSVTDIFDKVDENDDFWNREFSSRNMDGSVAEEINRAVRNRKVLLVLCNNIVNDKLIDDLGIPMGRWDRNAVLWTTGMNISSEAASASANWKLRIKPSNKAEALDLVYKEAAEIARYIEESSGAKIASYIEESKCGSLQTAQILVFHCFWYCLLLCRAFNRSELLEQLEAVKYFVCDEILRGDAAWEIGRALAKLIGPIIKYQLQYWSTWTLRRWVEKELLPPKTLLIGEKLSLEKEEEEEDEEPSSEEEEKEEPSSEEEEEEPSSEGEESYRWISVRSPQNNNPEPWDFLKKYRMSEVSSVFWHFEKTHKDLPDDFFDHFSNIRVLDLLGCKVSPINSSFLRLRNLRMLRLERCEVTSLDPNSHSSTREGRQEQILFDNLWVLNLYNSYADTFLLGGKAFELIPNLRELDLNDESSLLHLVAPNEFREHMHKLEVLKLSGNVNTEFLPRSLSMAINLKELILTDCKGLQYLNFNLPATIETISLESCPSLEEVELVDPSTAAPLPNLKSFHLSHSKLIAKLSLQGCRKLENVDLQELTVLKVLNLSCTAIKVVDITKLPQLKQLFLLGCQQLRRVVGLGKGPKLDALYLDTYNGGNACDVDHCLDSFQNQSLPDLTEGTNDADQRSFRAHVVVRDVRLFRSLDDAFPDLSRAKALSHIHVKSSSTTKKGINIGTTTKSNATITSALCYADVLNTMTDRRNHPSPPTMPLNNHIEVDGDDDFRIVSGGKFTKIMKFANSLFVHDNTDNSYMFHEYEDLKCLRIERCPDVTSIIFPNGLPNSLEIIWFSQLPRLEGFHGADRTGTRKLKHIYLEFCVRLKYVLDTLLDIPDLETINIRYCNDLTAIFNHDDRIKEKMGDAPKHLPNLKSIHLQELPKLQHIYKHNIRAPLKELKIRGCFNLRKLPLFDRSDADSMSTVSCEKDWWDKLQWDESEKSNHINLKHSDYYKKPMKARWL